MNQNQFWVVPVVAACLVASASTVAQRQPGARSSVPETVAYVVEKPVVEPLVEPTTNAADDSKPALQTVVPQKPRVVWKNSRVVGRAEEPAPFAEEVAYPQIHFKNPVVMVTAPGSQRWFVGEQRGLVYSFKKDREATQADLFLDVSKIVPPAQSANQKSSINNAPVKGLEALYGLTFHPQFEQNRFVYVCYVVRGEKGQLADGTRVSRFTVTDTDPPQAKPESEEVVITWLQGGHNGGCLAFGPDGCLYVSTGDGGFANPPDGLNAGQDVTNLLSSVLRIDVDHPAAGQQYSIPKDNPFVDLPGARGEIWCYGLRNPWKMKFDRANGDLWIGDVGWELWELVFKGARGANFGWSVVEGRQSVHPERKVGPTPIVPPTLEIPHTDGVSITGGYVYRGKKYPELVGQYLFGDWETRRIWGSKWDEASKSMTPMKDVIESNVRLVDFAEDHDGELYLLDYDAGTVHSIVPNPAATNANQRFPTKLSETGLFESLATNQPSPGVRRFDVNVAQWADFATADRYVGVPVDEPIVLLPSKQQITGSMFQNSMQFPKNSVLAKTLSLEMEQGRADSKRRVETQLLHFDGRFWRGYTYAWNDQQTDAELVERHGRDLTLSVVDAAAPGGRREQTWHFPSRMECVRCHNQWAEYALAFNTRQLNLDVAAKEKVNQLDWLQAEGVVELRDDDDKLLPVPSQGVGKLVNPHDTSAALPARARSYLHANCAHCHRTGGGGSAYLELREELSLPETKVVNVKPTQGTFEIPEAKIVTAGDPFRSTLFYRVSKTGSGRMPHIGSEIVDPLGRQLIHDWIRQLPVHFDADMLLTKLRDSDDEVAAQRDVTEAPPRIRKIARQKANERRAAKYRADGKEAEIPRTPAEVLDEDRVKAAEQDLHQANARKAQRASDRAAAVQGLLSSLPNTLILVEAMARNELLAQTRQFVIEAAAARPEPQIRDLFEQFLPAERRVKRLGATVRAEQLLVMKGDATKGRELFFNTTGISCKNCHRIGEVGGKLGPELTAISKRINKAQILDSILEPSKIIDPKFVSYVVVTNDGKSVTGLLVDRKQHVIVLRTAKDEEVRIPSDMVEEIAPQRQSIMPELLLKDMTAAQVADLLEFLSLGAAN